MPGSGKEIKRRRKSASNIQQITKAMETVSATKMRHAQERAIAGRAYAQNAFLLLESLALTLDVSEHALLAKKNTGKQLVVLIATDKGLVGALNTNLFRKMDDFIRSQNEKKRETEFLVIGKKASHYAHKTGKKIIAEFDSFDDNFLPQDIREVSEKMTETYMNGEYDKVIMAFTNFISTLAQKPFIRGILPLTHEKIEELGDLRKEEIEKLGKMNEATDYLFEPSKREVLDKLLPRLVNILIYHNLLEANASEHSARMIAMKSASDNATELIDDLTLTYNRLRQEGITSELAEISAGAGSLNS